MSFMTECSKLSVYFPPVALCINSCLLQEETFLLRMSDTLKLFPQNSGIQEEDEMGDC